MLFFKEKLFKSYCFLGKENVLVARDLSVNIVKAIETVEIQQFNISRNKAYQRVIELQQKGYSISTIKFYFKFNDKKSYDYCLENKEKVSRSLVNLLTYDTDSSCLYNEGTSSQAVYETIGIHMMTGDDLLPLLKLNREIDVVPIEEGFAHKLFIDYLGITNIDNLNSFCENGILFTYSFAFKGSISLFNLLLNNRYDAAFLKNRIMSIIFFLQKVVAYEGSSIMFFNESNKLDNNSFTSWDSCIEYSLFLNPYYIKFLRDSYDNWVKIKPHKKKLFPNNKAFYDPAFFDIWLDYFSSFKYCDNGSNNDYFDKLFNEFGISFKEWLVAFEEISKHNIFRDEDTYLDLIFEKSNNRALYIYNYNLVNSLINFQFIPNSFNILRKG